MLVDGWAGRMVQVDYSHTVIEQMKQRYNDAFYENISSPACMEFVCHDLIKAPLPYEAGSFDLIVAKGVMDAILCSPGGNAAAFQLINECHRLLAPSHGIFFVVTNGRPDDRTVLLEKDGSLDNYWQSVDIHPVPHGGNKRFSDYVYICRKKQEASYPLSLDQPLSALSGKENAHNTQHRRALFRADKKKS